jgi:prevent-host-death family protein
MKTISVYEAKAKLSEVLRIVKSRRVVVITERGVPIAKIVPLEQEDEPLGERLARLTAEGLLHPAAESPRSAVPAAAPGKGALKRFLADRS